MSKEKYVIVTGGAGYIGSHTVVELTKRGYVPVILDDFRNSNRDIIEKLKKLVQGPFHFEEIDVTDATSTESIFKKYHASGVIHFAAYKAVGESVSKPLLYFDNNINSLLIILKLSIKYGIKDFVFSSSCTVYGEPDGTIVNELTETKPAFSPYGATKQMCERILMDTMESGVDLKLLNLRYFNPVGAHPSGEIGELPAGKPNNLLPYVTQTGAGVLEKLTVFGSDYETEDGTCLRDYIHVVDLAKAHVLGLDWLEDQPKSTNETLNVGTGKGTSVLEIIHTFEQVTGIKLNWEFGPRREGDVEQIYADNSKLKKLLNWSPSLTIEDAIRDAWRWEQNYRNG